MPPTPQILLVFKHMVPIPGVVQDIEGFGPLLAQIRGKLVSYFIFDPMHIVPIQPLDSVETRKV